MTAAAIHDRNGALSVTQAALVGYDVQGFSRAVQRAALIDGRGAGELAAARILAGQARVTALAAAAGFEPIDSIGDGAIYARLGVRPAGAAARDLERLVAELRYVHLQATDLRVRAAWAHGEVRRWAPPVTLQEQEEFVFGPGIQELHVRVRRAPVGRGGALPGRPAPATLADPGGRIVEAAFIFVRLASAATWATIGPGLLSEAVELLARWGRMQGGHLQRLTHDEKGLHARLSLPDSHQQHSSRSADLEALGQGLRGLGLDAAIGAARGPAYFGPGPEGTHLVHGHAVNHAAKLMSGCLPGAIAIDQGFDHQDPPPHILPGSVGRSAETRAAGAWLSQHQSRLVLIRGEAGIGKTQLMRDLFEASPERSRVWIEATPSQALRPYGVWRDALAAAVARQFGGLPSHSRIRWASEVLAEAGLETTAIQLLGDVLWDSVAPGPDVSALPDGARARLTEEGLIALVRGLADGRLLIAFDDLHLADPSSHVLLGRVLREPGAVRVLATARPTPDANLAALALDLSTLTLDLGPLAPRHLKRLVRDIAPGEETDSAVRLSGGNPLTAIQLAASQGTAPTQGSVAHVLDRRLDGLGTDESQVLQALATGERGWTSDQTSRLTGLAPAEVALAAGSLVKARLVARDMAETRLRPAHPLIRDAVMGRAPLGVRRLLARRAAYARGREAGDGARVPAAEIAGLWNSAGAGGRAAVCYARAASEALYQGSADTSAQLLEHALAAAPDASRRLRWMAELASARWSNGRVGAANEMARAVLKAARRAPPASATRTAALLAASVRAETGQFMGSLKETFAGASAAQHYAAGSQEHLGTRGRSFGTIAYLLGILRAGGLAERAIHAALELSRRSGDPRPGAYALTARGIVAYCFMRWAEGDQAMREACALCEGKGEHHLEEVIETTLGMGGHLQGDAKRALAHFDALRRRAVFRRHRLHEAWAGYAAAQTLLRSGEPHRAWDLLTAAEPLLEGSEDVQSRHICLGLRAQLALQLGETDVALAAAVEAGRVAHALPPTNYTSLEGYSAAPLVGGLMALSASSVAEKTLGMALMRRHLRDITGYARVYRLAQPRLMTLRALAKSISEPAVGRVRLDAAIMFASARGMAFETQLATDLRRHPALV